MTPRKAIIALALGVVAALLERHRARADRDAPEHGAPCVIDGDPARCQFSVDLS